MRWDAPRPLHAGAGASAGTGTGTGTRATYACDIVGCSLSFSKPIKLTTHTRAVHLKEKRFSCVKCAFTSAWLGCVKRHLEVHMDRAWACDAPGCLVSFTTSDRLSRHKQSHLDVAEVQQTSAMPTLG